MIPKNWLRIIWHVRIHVKLFTHNDKPVPTNGGDKRARISPFVYYENSPRSPDTAGAVGRLYVSCRVTTTGKKSLFLCRVPECHTLRRFHSFYSFHPWFHSFYSSPCFRFLKIVILYIPWLCILYFCVSVATY